MRFKLAVFTLYAIAMPAAQLARQFTPPVAMLVPTFDQADCDRYVERIGEVDAQPVTLAKGY